MFYRIMNDVRTVLLSVGIVEELELIWVCWWRVDLFLLSCGCWRKLENIRVE